jgi:hypothetical protein
MKRLLTLLVTGCALACTQPQPAGAQEYKTQVKKEFTPTKAASSSVLSIYNIFGSIKVEGYAGDKVIFEIDQKISAKTESGLEEGKQEFKLEFMQGNDTIMAYIAEPYDSRPNRRWEKDRDPWGESRKINYKYELNFTVKVPYGFNLNVSTVNNGDVTVKDVSGSLRVHNVNGDISVSNAKSGAMDIRTVNGDVTVTHQALPSTDSKYYTLNGRLEVVYPANLAADLQFKSMNGSFYTDFPDAEIMPARVTKTQEKKSGGLVYKLNKSSDVRIGGGGKTYSFETLNGNIYIKKQS